MNRFKGLDVGRMPEELWMKALWLSEEGLQIAVKRKEAKGKQERERFIQVNAEFQKIARRDKKPFKLTMQRNRENK